ncbi:DUF5362 domain-containing protein [Gallaecimonas mangrovi]|uniref:DUF5362 domain-containing protein n=1 Tax=Gallaecimonas mangrovi TaxID=2291597 RepID=UPI000E209E2F|nr:DUF5362 domain-containing protein [Gallaecimonas mangrovi]
MQTEQESLIQQLTTPLFQAKGWMKLMGVLFIIGGVIQALSIIGILWAWLPIWLGISLFQCARAIENAQLSGSTEALAEANRKLKTYFTIMGVSALVGVLLTVAFFLLGGIGMLMSMSGHMGAYQ